MIRSSFFRVENGVIAISGKEFGYIITRQEFRNSTCARSSNGARGPTRPARARHATTEFSTTCKGRRESRPPPSNSGSSRVGREICWMTDGGALTGINGVQVTGPAESALKDRPHRQGSMERCGRIPRSGRRDGKTARRVELAGTGGTRRSPQAVRQREAGRRGLPSVPIQWKDPVPIRGSRSILSRH